MNTSIKINIVRPFLPAIDEIFHDLKECLDSGMVTNNSKHVVNLEQRLQEYFDSKLKPLCFCNGEMALFNLIQAHKLKMGYGPHDSFNVLVPSLTFSGTLNAILMNNLKPVFCDVDDTLTIDLSKAEFDDVKMIVLVGAYGNLPDVDLLSSMVNEHELDVIFDNAPAFGSTYKGKFVSNYGYSEIFSFHASKIMNSMEGGTAITSDEDVWSTLYKLRDFGQYEKVRGNVDVAGLNSKMQEVSALVGLKNLEKIDLIVDKRTQNVQRYNNFFENFGDEIDTMSIRDDVFCTYLYYPIILKEEATEFVDYMQSNGVVVRRYYTAVHLLDLYRDKYKTQDLSFTNSVKDRLVALPIHTVMNDDEISHLFETVSNFFKRS